MRVGTFYSADVKHLYSTGAAGYKPINNNRGAAHERYQTQKEFLTVEAEPYEDLRRLGDLAGFNPDWISLELNRMIKALRSVAQQAIEDSKTKGND